MKNKSGQVFTLIAITLIGLLLISFEIFSISQQRFSVKTRISTMENFLYSTEENLERQLYISGFRIIFLAENEITNRGQYINNIDSFFNEAFFNGTVDGNVQEILSGATYGDLILSLNEKSEKVNVGIILSNSSIDVRQTDPWHVNFTLTFNFLMEDKADLAKWEKEQKISALIPVSGFEDPFYIINTNAKVSRKINATIYQGNYTDGTDVSNLISHLNKKYYVANPDAPNFLKRLQGDFSSDENGIESFVDLSELSSQGIQVKDKTGVDHIYFSSDNPAAYVVSGMPVWFKLDSEHLDFYNVSHLTI
ncbi:MAG: hypothetical protein WC584_03845 [Candidatus Pacearchaeota archaeon]